MNDPTGVSAPPPPTADEFASLRRRVAHPESRVAAARSEGAVLRALCDSLPLRMGLVEWIDGEVHLVWANEAFASFYGVRADALAGLHHSELNLTPEYVASWRQTYLKVMESGRPTSVEVYEPRSRSWGLATVAPVRGEPDDPPRFSFVIADLTDRKRAEEERLLLERKLQEGQKLESLGVLAGGIAHDFNNLLVAVMGNASLIEAELPGEADCRHELAQIRSAAERAADLCRQMLAYSGRGRFATARLDLGALVREMLELLRLSVSKKATVVCDLAGPMPPVLADATQVRQVIMNLVLNASEAIGDRAGVIRITGEVRRTADGPRVCLEVSDTGCGMDEATRARIFEPFFTTKFTGRGLGLSAVLGIVRSHNGAVEVESEPGRGSTVRILLPPAEGTPETPPDRPAPPPAPPKEEGTVLVADDEVWVRDVTARMLAALGFRVVQAGDGEEALARFQEEADRLRLVLLDLTMPRMDGEEVFRTLHLLKPDLPVILMSGFSEQEAAGRFVGKGLAGFLPKPFRLEDLAARVRAALSGK